MPASPSDLSSLNTHLSQYPYITGYTPTDVDHRLALVVGVELDHLPHFARWHKHVLSFDDHARVSWPSARNSVLPVVQTLLSTSLGTMTPHVDTSNAGDANKVPDTTSLVEAVLRTVDKQSPIDSLEIAAKLGEDHQRVIGAIKSIETHEGMITVTPISKKSLTLTGEGETMASNGSHEATLFNALPAEGGMPHADVMKLPNAKIGFAKAIQAKWIELDKKAAGGAAVTRKVASIEDTVKTSLVAIQNGESVNDQTIAEFKKRKLVTESTVKSMMVGKGVAFALNVTKLETDLTADMIQSGAWRTTKFKPYNLNARGAPPAAGHLHPLLKVRSEFRHIFLEMGFAEMPTNRYVESSFWNFDALFQPQQHPARDAHDTFFISDPSTCGALPEWYVEAVKKMHSTGGNGSIGYQYDWQLGEAKKNLLRTHTTAVSARMLYQLAQQKEFKPVKYFSIDRVFRNETLDATHLAEFHQVEGVIADRGISLADLIGVLHEFFQRLGLTKLRFKPAYNPYTEPSMEIFAFHPGLDKWVEIGNSGVFRPEMLSPMNLPADVNVIAWGLSLERPTMIKYGIPNIRSLFGPKVDLKMIYDNAICRLDKD